MYISLSVYTVSSFCTPLIAAESDFVLLDSHTKQFISCLPVVIKKPIFTLNFFPSFASSRNRFHSILSSSYRLLGGSEAGIDQVQ
jgi:hypothetical protein